MQGHVFHEDKHVRQTYVFFGFCENLLLKIRKTVETVDRSPWLNCWAIELLTFHWYS